MRGPLGKLGFADRVRGYQGIQVMRSHTSKTEPGFSVFAKHRSHKGFGISWLPYPQ